MKHVDTIVLVEDIHISRAFYEEIMGLEVVQDWGNMIIFHALFAIHQADKLLPENETDKLIRDGKQGRHNLIIYFEVEDIEKEYERIIKHDIEIIHGIIELPWQKIFRILDPDKHIIEIGGPHR